MLHYPIRFDCGNHGNSQADVEPIVVDVRVFAIAEKYFIEPLKKLAANKSAGRAKQDWRTSAFAIAATEAYESVPEHERTLRQIVEVAAAYATDLLNKSGPFDDFRRAMLEIPELAYAL